MRERGTTKVEELFIVAFRFIFGVNRLNEFPTFLFFDNVVVYLEGGTLMIINYPEETSALNLVNYRLNRETTGSNVRVEKY